MALEPAAVAFSLQAGADLERERQRLEKHWRQRRQRARYEVELAERRYQAVDAGNRLVAATLEKRWEEALGQERQLQEEYDRFVRETPVQLTDEERGRIEGLLSGGPSKAHRKLVMGTRQRRSDLNRTKCLTFVETGLPYDLLIRSIIYAHGSPCGMHGSFPGQLNLGSIVAANATVPIVHGCTTGQLD